MHLFSVFIKLCIKMHLKRLSIYNNGNNSECKHTIVILKVTNLPSMDLQTVYVHIELTCGL